MGQLVCHHHCYDLLYNLNRVHFLNRHFQNPTIHQMLWWILQIDFLHPPPSTRVCVYSDIGQTEKVFLFWYVCLFKYIFLLDIFFIYIFNVNLQFLMIRVFHWPGTFQIVWSGWPWSFRNPFVFSSHSWDHKHVPSCLLLLLLLLMMLWVFCFVIM